MRRNTRERPSHLVDRQPAATNGKESSLVPSLKQMDKRRKRDMYQFGRSGLDSRLGDGNTSLDSAGGRDRDDLRFVNYTSFVVVAATPTGIHVSRVYYRIAWV